MEKIVAANLKMNFTLKEVEQYINELKQQDNSNNFIIFPSSLYLENFVNNDFKVGSQNICDFENGAYTGEISAKQVKSIGCDYTLVGHSERRKNYHETDEMINEKVRLALENNLKVVICIGETLEERKQNRTERVLRSQIEIGLKSIDDLSNVIIAYEPVWAISSSGTGIVATNEDIYNATKFIKDTVYDNYAFDIKVLYGGSVNENNIEEINRVDNISGVLVGGASLKPEKIERIKDVVFN